MLSRNKDSVDEDRTQSYVETPRSVVKMRLYIEIRFDRIRRASKGVTLMLSEDDSSRGNLTCSLSTGSANEN